MSSDSQIIENRPTKSYLGLIVILLKLSPKLLPILSKLLAVVVKLLKGLLGFKAVGAAASLGLYTLMFTWQMALALVVFLLVHEYGHLRAMKKCGLKTSGIYLIPGFGAVAVASEKWKKSQDEAYIAIMGPIFSLWFIIPAIILYLITQNPIFAAMASLMSFINLFNLFPINPLDGGRVVKSLLYSVKGSFGFYFPLISLIAAIIISIELGFSLLAIIAAIGLMETFYDYGLSKSMPSLTMTLARIFWLTLIGVAGLMPTISLIAGLSSPSIWAIALILVIDIVGFIILLADINLQAHYFNKPWTYYPVIVITDFFRSIKEIFTLKPGSLKPIEDYEPMAKKYLLFYTGIYILTIFAMIGLMIYAAQVPGAEIGREMLK